VETAAQAILKVEQHIQTGEPMGKRWRTGVCVRVFARRANHKFNDRSVELG
jgi:hypothetical protein